MLTSYWSPIKLTNKVSAVTCFSVAPAHWCTAPRLRGSTALLAPAATASHDVTAQHYVTEQRDVITRSTLAAPAAIHGPAAAEHTEIWQ